MPEHEPQILDVILIDDQSEPPTAIVAPNAPLAVTDLGRLLRTEPTDSWTLLSAWAQEGAEHVLYRVVVRRPVQYEFCLRFAVPHHLVALQAIARAGQWDLAVQLHDTRRYVRLMRFSGGNAGRAPVPVGSAPSRLQATAGPSLLVIHEDSEYANLLRFALNRAGWSVRLATDLSTGERLAQEVRPQLALIELALTTAAPGPWHPRCPLIGLAGASEIGKAIEMLERGHVDDYVVTPVNPRELIARIRARLRVFGSQADNK